MSLQKLLKEYQETLEETLRYFDLPEAELNKSYGEGKWNVRQLLNHITDAESVMYERIRRTIAKPKQVIYGFDQEAWAEVLDYNSFPLAINKNIFYANRMAIIYLAEQYYDTHSDSTFVHSETGLRTLKDELEKVAWHNRGHLDQIRKALS